MSRIANLLRLVLDLMVTGRKIKSLIFNVTIDEIVQRKFVKAEVALSA